MVGELSFETSDPLGVALSENGRFKIAIHGILDLIAVRSITVVLFAVAFPLKKWRKFLIALAAIFKSEITQNASLF